MKKQTHILNGDALKQQFPENIIGEIIVARECLVDGNVQGNNLDELFANRATFLSQHYGGTKQDYYEKAASEIRKIVEISHDSDINLWFEDDLFCQVNFWFVVNLLLKNVKDTQIFLVRPKTHSQYGFGGLNKSELISIFEDRLLLTDLQKISNLWASYQSDNTEKLAKTARELQNIYPFVLPAVEAHIQRIPINGNLGKPTLSLIAIMKELETEEFEPIFREFNRRDNIYGFGDIQVKRLYDEIIDSHI